jgi:hypothetical protein
VRCGNAKQDPIIPPPLTPGTRYRVTGYHTGDFVGEFISETAVRLPVAEFRVAECSDAELVGQIVEVPRHFARIVAVDQQNVTAMGPSKDATFGG